MDTDRELEETLAAAPTPLRSYGGQGGFTREKVRVVTHCCAMLRESSRKFAQIRAVVTRCYALLRVGLFLTTDGHE